MEKELMSMFVHFHSFFLAKTTFELLEYCSSHISEFMTQGFWDCVQNVSF